MKRKVGKKKKSTGMEKLMQNPNPTRRKVGKHTAKKQYGKSASKRC